jgi:hypothetical protein
MHIGLCSAASFRHLSICGKSHSTQIKELESQLQECKLEGSGILPYIIQSIQSVVTEGNAEAVIMFCMEGGTFPLYFVYYFKQWILWPPQVLPLNVTLLLTSALN